MDRVKVQEDLTNRKFGKWLVLSRSDDLTKYKKPVPMWKCQCECGTIRDVRGYTLRHGMSASCGCVAKQGLHRTHNKSHLPLYRVWSRMKSCTTLETHQDYKYYGARGLKMCKEWFDDFEKFYQWSIANGYKRGLEIDRIDNDGNYEPSNCRWVTRKKQLNNTSRNRNITFNGKTQSVKEWSEELGFVYNTLYARIFHFGWDTEKAFTTPVRGRGKE